MKKIVDTVYIDSNITNIDNIYISADDFTIMDKQNSTANVINNCKTDVDTKANKSIDKKNNLSKRNLGIYIHIPFCLSKCNYCDFCSGIVADEKIIDNYVTALCENIKLAGSSMREGYIVDTIFIGGGTPSILSGEHFKMMSNAISLSFDCLIVEFTSEGNPNTLTKKHMLAMRDAGINRLSIGVQTINDNILESLGRKSKRVDAEKCLTDARKIFNNISCDIMVGLPAQTLVDVAETVTFLLKYGVNHISCYNLQLEEGTRLHGEVMSGKLQLPTENESVAMYDLAYDMLKKEGFCRYEVSNFAKGGMISHHNMRYWRRLEYVGFGVSSASLLGNTRFTCGESVAEYIKNANNVNYVTYSPEFLFGEKTILTETDKLEEYIMLGLRTESGLDIEFLNGEFDMDFCVKYEKAIAKNKQFLTIINHRIKIKDEFMYVMNSIISDFMD